MAIIKIIKRENPYIQIDKTGINDKRLSWGASGLLTYLMGLPKDWNINLTHLSKVKEKDKKDKTRGYLNELRENGYCHYFEVRKNGKIRENFYLVFEVPTSYKELLENYIEVPEGYVVSYKPVVKESSKSIGNKELLPKLENPTAETTTSVKPTQLIIYNTKDIYTKNHDHDDLDFFENLFKDFKINFTKKNQDSIRKLLKTLSKEEVVKYLRELYNDLNNNPNVKDIAKLFSAKIERGERQIIQNKNKIILKENERGYDLKRQERIIMGFYDYWLNYRKVGYNSLKIYKNFVLEINDRNLDEILVKSYCEKMKKELKLE